MKIFLQRKDTRLAVILEKRPVIKSKAITEILSNPANDGHRIQIGYIDIDCTTIFDDNKKRHFTIADDRMFRKEEDTTNFLASASFNDPVKTAELKSLFAGMNPHAINNSTFVPQAQA